VEEFGSQNGRATYSVCLLDDPCRLVRQVKQFEGQQRSEGGRNSLVSLPF
jgi:hypothetical protein